jgi:hypothetical protein
VPSASFEFPRFVLTLFLHYLSRGSVDVPALWVEVTRAREATAAVEAVGVAVVLAAETSAQEVAVTRVKDAEDRAALTEREARERVSRVEAVSTGVLPSAHEEIEGLVWKIVLLEGELAEVLRDREVAEETARGLSDAVTGGVWERALGAVRGAHPPPDPGL